METELLAGFRLSPQQERIVACATDAGYPVSVCLYMCEGLNDVETVRSALRTVVARHEILRTVFRKHQDLRLPLQMILDEDTPDLPHIDLTEMSSQDQQRELHFRFTSASEQFGKATDAFVVTCTIFSLGERKHALLVTVPSLCADAASFSVLAEDLRQALSNEIPSGDLLQYVDVTEWQHDLLDSSDEAGTAAKAYWRNQAHTPLSLPLEVASTAAPSGMVESMNIRLRPDDCSLLSIFARANDVTDADVLLAAWHLLLHRMTGENRVVILTAAEGREYDEIKGAIGLFARYLPVSVDFEGRARFDDVLRNVSSSVKQGRKQQEWFAPGSSTAQSAIGFEYHDLRYPVVADATFVLKPIALHVVLDHFKLRLIATVANDEVSIDLEYDTSRYSRDLIEQLGSAFEVLLTHVLANPNAPLREFSLLTEDRTTQLLFYGRGPVVSVPFVSMSSLIVAQALRTPGAEAVRSGADVVTYGELDGGSNRLGHSLLRLGVKRGSLVGLCVSRSAAMMVPVLAILKAGGAYVALDAEQPKARTAQQMEGVEVLLTEAALVDRLPEFGGQIVVLDGANRPWEEETEAALEGEAGSDDLAYVIYTSGSTGRPKGVGVRHGNLVNYALHMVRSLGLDERPLQYATVSTMSADLGNTVIYPALLTGGCLHVLPYEVATDSHHMSAYQARYKIDVLKIVPSHLAALLESGGTAVLPNKYLITGGEALRPALVERILGSETTTCELINHYGPTETTVGSLMLPLKEYDWKHSPSATVPIGRPIANTRVYVLDPHQQLVPVGVAGELYIGGAGVTAGYINQPEMTAERFVADPFTPGERMYRTGDLVRWVAGDLVEFLGRTDDQVKIRGFRVELGEIETVLAAQPGVRQCVVMARAKQDTPDDRQVVAYVVLDRQQGTTSEALKLALRERLPDHMVPAAIVELQKLPLTANGKVDRAALPAPEERSARIFKAPAGVTEELVAQIWEQVLKVQNISTDENFFDLGGHSLMATQVISRIRRVLCVDLPLRTIFDTPTVSGLADSVDASRLPGGIEAMDTMTSVPRNGALPLSYAQQRLWILDQMEPNSSLYNIPRTLRLRGPLQAEALAKSLNEIMRRHEPLRTWFSTESGTPVQHIEIALELHVKQVDLTQYPPADREAKALEIAIAEAATPFDLSVAPLLRTVLVKLDSEDHVLLLTMHHIVSDAWSAALFTDELRALYEGFSTGTSPMLPELTLQYADYASWQRNWLQGETLNKQLAFWRDQLAGAPPLLTLPTDYPRPEKQSFAGDLLRFTLPAELLLPLKALCRQEGITLFMALLSVYQILLSRLSGQDQVVVGTDSANRFTVETERMIGFFINLLALKTDFTGDPTFLDVLRRARETTLACYARQEMPFDKIVEELRPERTLSHNPILQVLFVMQNAPKADRQFGGLEVTGFSVPLTRSKFDIAVFAVEREDSVECIWVYSTELFESSTVGKMAKMLATVIASALANPETRVSALKLYTDEQEKKFKEEKLDRKQSSKKKLMSTGLKAFDLGSGAAK